MKLEERRAQLEAEDEAHLLASVYQSCLDLAKQHHIKSIALPSLSTGAYGYPVTLAAPIALDTVITHIKKPTSLQEVMFVLFSRDVYAAYDQALTKLLAQ